VVVQDVSFRTAAAARWQELRAPLTGALSDQWVVEEIAAVKQLLGSGPGTAGQRNFLKYSTTLNVPGFGVPFADWPSMFAAETTILQEWVLARLKWLDAAFAAQALPTAGPDAYMKIGYVVSEPAVAGPTVAGSGRLPAVAGRRRR